jgi:hypothetical protein
MRTTLGTYNTMSRTQWLYTLALKYQCRRFESQCCFIMAQFWTPCAQKQIRFLELPFLSEILEGQHPETQYSCMQYAIHYNKIR